MDRYKSKLTSNTKQVINLVIINSITNYLTTLSLFELNIDEFLSYYVVHKKHSLNKHNYNILILI